MAQDNLQGLGLVLTGYADKKSTWGWHRRFLVLTHESFHWFKREAGYDLFGEERGHIGRQKIASIRLVDNQTFEIVGQDKATRLFRISGESGASTAEEWVSAVKAVTRSRARRGTLSNFRAGVQSDNKPRHSVIPTVVSVVAVRTAQTGAEHIISRAPKWERRIVAANLQPSDVLVISTSDGGAATLGLEELQQNQKSGGSFRAPITGAPLASYLVLSVLSAAEAASEAEFSSTPPASPSLPSSPRSGKTRAPPPAFADSPTSSPSLLPASTDIPPKSLVDTVCSICRDGPGLASLSLSLCTLLVGLLAIDHITPETSLLFLFCMALAIQGVVQVLLRARFSPLEGVTLTLVVHEISFSSRESDEDDGHGPSDPPSSPRGAGSEAGGEAEDDESANNGDEGKIPQRFIDGCDGNLVEARRRWDATRKWRREEGVDHILHEKQPHFFKIKECYPHYHAGRGKGGHVCFWERPGDLQLEELNRVGITTDDLVRHWIFTTEYQWVVLLENDQTAKSIAVIDVKGTGLMDLAGTRLDYIKKTVAFANHHYPERSHVVYIVNAGWVFTSVWSIVRPWVHPNTQRKVSGRSPISPILSSPSISASFCLSRLSFSCE